jgi:Domain of unknown function (DUF3806)
MAQKIGALSQDDTAHNERQRGWVRDHYEEGARHRYDSVEGKIELLDTIIKSDWIAADETWKLQSLGVTFGDVLVQKLGLNWVAVDDDVGRDRGLQDPETTILLFPVTAISKRIESGESVDVRALIDFFCEKIVELRKEADPS